MARFDIKIDPFWSVPLLLIGATQSRSWAEIGDDEIVVKFGIGEVRLPLAQVASVEPHRWPLLYGIGHRIGYGGMAFVGSTEGVVKIELKKPVPMDILFGIMKRFPRFFVSLQDPQGFASAVHERVAKQG